MADAVDAAGEVRSQPGRATSAQADLFAAPDRTLRALPAPRAAAAADVVAAIVSQGADRRPSDVCETLSDADGRPIALPNFPPCLACWGACVVSLDRRRRSCCHCGARFERAEDFELRGERWQLWLRVEAAA